MTKSPKFLLELSPVLRYAAMMTERNARLPHNGQTINDDVSPFILLFPIITVFQAPMSILSGNAKYPGHHNEKPRNITVNDFSELSPGTRPRGKTKKKDYFQTISITRINAPIAAATTMIVTGLI